jgi:hypothetical protein
MNEKTYRTMSRIGGTNIAMGIISIVIGTGLGVLMIITGARLLKRKYEIMI